MKNSRKVIAKKYPSGLKPLKYRYKKIIAAMGADMVALLINLI
jgi:hypothetical protein